MPQGPPPPGNYSSHAAIDLSKQTPNIRQAAHHPLPPGKPLEILITTSNREMINKLSLGALPSNQQIPMANSGHGGPMQQGRSAQGNPLVSLYLRNHHEFSWSNIFFKKFYSGRNQQIRPGSLPRPPMAATSIGPNHPPNTANMPAYPGNPSLAMNVSENFSNQSVCNLW